MAFKFQDGDEVALRADRHRFLPAGTQGIVFCRYAIDPPAYEVNFQDVRGETFGTIVEEDEVAPVSERGIATTHTAVQAA